MEVTDVFEKNISAFNSGKRLIINQGGTSSSKTWSILQLLYLIAKNKDGLLISVVSETLPHLKKGAFRDFLSMLQIEGVYDIKCHNRSDNIYTVGKSKIEFFSADEPGKVRGPRRDILYINECDNIRYSVYGDLEVRTKKTIFLDYNPVQEFWVNEQLLTLPETEYEYIHSTYLDNHLLDANIVRSIEMRRTRDPEWWKVFGLGITGRIEGMVFHNWKLCDEMPETPRQIHGMDFGFTNDPTTLIDIRLQGGEIWLDELLFRTGMTNAEIARFVKDEGLEKKLIIADSSEPKSIKELSMAGLKITGAVKGADSVNHGIDLIKQYPVNITKRSVNMIKEFRNYKWRVDKDGRSMNVPIDLFNHTIDPTRYGLQELVVEKRKAVYNF